MESDISNPTKKRQATYNNSSQKRSKLKTSAVDKGSEKKQPKKKIADIIKEYCADSNAVGRPKGSSDEATRELSASIEKATQEAVREFHEMKSKNRSKKARLRKGSLNEIIDLAKKKYSVPDSIIISTQTMRQRLKRGKNNGHAGHKSPMEDVEPYLVELIKKLAEMRTPVTTAQGLELANSLIKGKTVEKNWRNGKQNTAMAIGLMVASNWVRLIGIFF